MWNGTGTLKAIVFLASYTQELKVDNSLLFISLPSWVEHSVLRLLINTSVEKKVREDNKTGLSYLHWKSPVLCFVLQNSYNQNIGDSSICQCILCYHLIPYKRFDPSEKNLNIFIAIGHWVLPDNIQWNQYSSILLEMTRTCYLVYFSISHCSRTTVMGTLYLCVGFVLIFGSLNVLSLIGES